eukprot:584677-Prorocentrum_lima.AAC.1
MMVHMLTLALEREGLSFNTHKTKWAQYAGLSTDMLQIGPTYKSPQDHLTILGCLYTTKRDTTR